MKLLLIILALTVQHIASQDGSYTLVDPTEAQNDKDIQEAQKFGAQYIVRQLIQEGVIPRPASDYQVTKVNSVYRQLVSGLNYRFDLFIQNDGPIVIRTTYVVYQSFTNELEVTSYTYDEITEDDGTEEENEEEEEEEGTIGGWTEIDPALLDTDKELAQALERGVQDVVRQSIEKHLLPEAEYEVTQIHSIRGQLVAGMNYRFDVDLTNCAGLTARAVFTVFASLDGTFETTPESLDITDVPPEGLIGGTCEDDGQGQEEEETNEEEEEEEEEEETNEEEEEVNEEEVIIGGWTPIDLCEAKNDQEIQDVLDFGVKNVVKQGIQDGVLPDGKYKVSEIHSIESQVVAGINYRFNLDLTNCDGVTENVTFVVYYQPWSGIMELLSYTFNEDNY